MAVKCSGCKDGAALPFAIRTAFQPVVDLETGAPYAYEALVRGPNGEGAASVLAQVTDENRYAFDQACRVAAIRDAVAAGILDTGASLSINFLPNAVYSPMACIQLTLKTARETGLPLDRLIFEFTENERIEPDHLGAILHAYREIGFRTAIDDFGAGHAGLALLANFRTDIIKLDMELIRGIDTSLARRIIVAGILGFAAELGLRVVAEGVETEAELNALAAAGIRYVQGYLFAKPALGRLPEVEHKAAAPQALAM
jgi:EAL domain-containing protein (putative c-di-GMP-specific phosphodiesterase class I)